jgi:hypothetical protein
MQISLKERVDAGHCGAQQLVKQVIQRSDYYEHNDEHDCKGRDKKGVALL